MSKDLQCLNSVSRRAAFKVWGGAVAATAGLLSSKNAEADKCKKVIRSLVYSQSDEDYGPSLLGSYIFASNPYEAGKPPLNTWPALLDSKISARPKVSPPPTVVLVIDDCPDNYDPPYMLDFPGSELHDKPGQWKFKYADHYVNRAMRVPYMYYQKSKADPKVGILIRDYFLIGFEGGAGY